VHGFLRGSLCAVALVLPSDKFMLSLMFHAPVQSQAALSCHRLLPPPPHRQAHFVRATSLLHASIFHTTESET
jgi:hypothetical protein